MDEELDIRNKVIPKTFFLMFLGLLGTAILHGILMHQDY